ncbi:hypothetical protein ZIOFF_068242 [Zingiber officinale]|uniref:AB hydrolase-1 domain-containing protein n=1 Tax=Zingiber officinale TaxID=94328 RepID=A0A8J5EVL3_ZINOF|nr:hypothetical protein ZIOFF_068242 [Zingiber officinale]
MGNACGSTPATDTRGGIELRGSRRGMRARSQRKMTASEEELLHRQALAIAIQQTQLSQRFEGSMSRRIGSTSSRRRELPDSLANAKPLKLSQLPLQLEHLETKKIILVHGEGFGAWCWYKTISLLEEVGLDPIALDLRGSGIDNTDPNTIANLADYSKPLTDYLQSIPDDEKVILVGHSCGGASVSYAMECHPKKISKAIFLSATMVLDGQKPFDVLSDEVSLHLLNADSMELIARMILKSERCLQDIALAAASMRSIPLAPIMEKLSLTSENYGTVRRYFVQTLDDHMLSPDIQEKLVRENPPHGIYKIKGSDHCPFFSKPQSWHKILLEIAQLP